METNTSSPFKVILGSSSVARQKILAEMGYEFTIMSADIDEKGIRKDNPEELVMALAEAKADAIMSKLQTIDNQKDIKPTLLIASDTVVVYEGVVREKPSNKEEARQFIKGLLPFSMEQRYTYQLHQLVIHTGALMGCTFSEWTTHKCTQYDYPVDETSYSGGHAATVSSVIVMNLSTGLRKGDWDRVEIYFHDIPDDIIDSLIKEGKVLNVAGGLIIEHPLIVPYVKQVVGTTDSVMGLPKVLTEKLMKEAF